MATVTESSHRSLLVTKPIDTEASLAAARTVPILTPTIQMSAPSPGEPMEITTPTNTTAPNERSSGSKSPEGAGSGSTVNGNGNDADVNGAGNSSPPSDGPTPNASSSMPMPSVTAAAVHQPKIVQTAFIHKLYNMLEDPAIQHLISWSANAESFVMSPSQDFSKVLAQYFKHTNISSFVRQLNMYGFHKVSDVFHTGSPDSALWEFKHGQGNFKRGDLMGLREIKRRASRHALVHRDYNSSKPTPSQPGTPAEPMQPMQDASDPRVVEQSLYELNSRLQRLEDNAHFAYMKQQTAMDAVGRLLEISQAMARAFLSVVPNHDSAAQRDVAALQGEIQRQADIIRSLDEPEPPFPAGRQYFSGLENAPVSPRQLPQDDPRRPQLGVPPASSLAAAAARQSSNNHYRPPVPSNLSISTRRPYGSIGASTTAQPSPSSLRPQVPPPPPLIPSLGGGGGGGGGGMGRAGSGHRMGEPLGSGLGPDPGPPGPPGPHHLSSLAAVEPPPGSLARRHTSADIRNHGWRPEHNPFAPNDSRGPPPPITPSWPPPSPGGGGRAEDQRIRDSLSSYSLQAATQSQSHSRPTTPPPPPFLNGGRENGNGNGHGARDDGRHPSTNGVSDSFGSWSWSAANRADAQKNLSLLSGIGSLGGKDSSGPPTRRGSMAHILNPADTAEGPEDDRIEDDRKRKRLG